MTESGQLTLEHYREIAEEIRFAAARAASEEIRDELLQIAARYDRLAARAQTFGILRGPERPREEHVD